MDNVNVKQNQSRIFTEILTNKTLAATFGHKTWTY